DAGAAARALAPVARALGGLALSAAARAGPCRRGGPERAVAGPPPPLDRRDGRVADRAARRRPRAQAARARARYGARRARDRPADRLAAAGLGARDRNRRARRSAAVAARPQLSR